MTNEEIKVLQDADVFTLGQRGSKYSAYNVLTSWSDNADSITCANSIVITNADGIFVPTLFHDMLNLPWTSSDHGYDRELTTGFDYVHFKFSDKKHLNPFAEIYDRIQEQNNTGHWFKRIYVIDFDLKTQQGTELLASNKVFDTLKELSAARTAQIKAEQAQERKGADVDAIAKKITRMSNADKQKLLKLILKFNFEVKKGWF